MRLARHYSVIGPVWIELPNDRLDMFQIGMVLFDLLLRFADLAHDKLIFAEKGGQDMGFGHFTLFQIISLCLTE